MNLCDYDSIRALLGRHGFHFSKSMGQNFLIDPQVPYDIAASSQADEHCGVLEIGPGIGPLTAELAQRAAKVVSIELDKTLLPVLAETMADYPNVEIRLLNGDYHDVEQWLVGGNIDIGFVNVPCSLGCECIPLVQDRMLAIFPKASRYANYFRFPVVECEKEPFISLLEISDHDARRALDAAGVKPNVRFYTKDDYAIMAMVEQGLGMSIMPELLLRGRTDNLLTLPLLPDYKRTIGMAIAAGEQAGPATRKFADYMLRYVAENEKLEQRI